MSISERKEREKTALRGKILRAVEKLIRRGGFEDLSMRKIAGAIEYSPATIYRFFKNKEELLGAFTDSMSMELKKRLAAVADEPAGDLEKLKKLIRTYIRFSLANPNIYKLYVHLSTLSVKENGLVEQIGGKQYRIFSVWQSLLESMTARGDTKTSSPMDLLILIWHTTDGFILNRINQPGIPWNREDEGIDQLLEMIFNGILK